MSLSLHPTLSEVAEYAPQPIFLHQFFELAASRWPEHIALDVPPSASRNKRQQFTYAELERRANCTASFIQQFVTKECVVAILLPKTTDLYISQLAVLKAGAAYTCIDPSFPNEQIRDILQDAEAVAVLTDSEGLARIKQCGFDSERTFEAAALIQPTSDNPLSPQPSSSFQPTPNSLAYIIYTSGTTGRPKGVMIEHASIVNLVASDITEFGLTPNDRVGQSSSPAYDSSLEETWLGFAAGATVVVMDDETSRLGPDLIPWLQRERITVLCPPPTLLRTTGCNDPEKALPDLKLLYVGGEALPRDVADHWAKGRRLENGYGPTECTVTATRGTIFEDQPITIGKPIPGLQAWVLDESLAEVADGERGELCLGGISLARGYRNRPELTAQKFPTHPHLGRIYRTGDLVHRDADGNLHYHGRIDSQVKLRGYRIELEAIEARLAECAGVREAACRIQGEAGQAQLAAFIVRESDDNSPSFDELKASLSATLPQYMVPSRFAFIAELPTTVGGKLNRAALPMIEAPALNLNKESIAPRNAMEEKLAAAISRVLRLNHPVSVHDNFFHDLGGDSLNAAVLISLLRDDPQTESVTVRDLYEHPTVAGLAQNVRPATPHINVMAADEEFESASQSAGSFPILVTLLQALWLVLGLVVGSAASYYVFFNLLPLVVHQLGLIPFVLLSPLLLLAVVSVYTPLCVLFTALVKKVLIGSYQPMKAPVWSGFYLRHWMVIATARIIPWEMIEGTEFQNITLRMLGARIGHQVHIHRGVNLRQGGWDLLDIGDNVTISQDASIRLVELSDGHVNVGAVKLGENSTLGIRAGASLNSVLEPGAYLAAAASLANGGRIPAGERWDGIPAKPNGQAPTRPVLTSTDELSPFWQSCLKLLAQFALRSVLAIPYELPFIGWALFKGWNTEQALEWLYYPSLDRNSMLIISSLVMLSVPIALSLQALASRALGQVRPGVISRWSYGYIRVWLKTDLLRSAGEWLSGTLFWPFWLRLAGMNIGRGCEISTIIDVVPELIVISDDTFFADGIYLGGPLLHRGTVTLAMTKLGKNTFLGNHAIIPIGQQLPDDILLGVCTVADDRIIRPGTSWFGHPPFELPRREIIELDRSLTHEPSLIRYINRVFWELLRFSLPITPLFALPVLFELLSAAEETYSETVFLFVAVPALAFGMAAAFCLLILAMKWLLIGKVKPGIHPLWSCWCSRWDFLYVAWAVYARSALGALEGTLFLGWYLRAMGSKIGKRVVLGNGFSHVVDPDMLHFEDGSTVCCQFQAHTFEDRVLKIDHVWIRRRATVETNSVLLYGADIGERAYVAPHSVVMKRESLLPGHSYSGCPTKPE